MLEGRPFGSEGSPVLSQQTWAMQDAGLSGFPQKRVPEFTGTGLSQLPLILS